MEIGFEGFYLDGKTSKARPVRALFDGRRLRVEGEGVSLEPAVEECRVNPPVGKARRVLQLPGGGRLETDDLAAVARLEAHLGLNRGMTLVGRMEGRWGWVALSAVGLVLFTWGFIRFGIPAVAGWAAFVTPISVMEPVSQQALRLFDSQYMKPSALPPARRAELERHFRQVTRQIGGSYNYRLELRSSPRLGANALALPSGVIVVTDDLVALAKNDREIVGVMAHEVGHVTRRHGLRSVYQSAGVLLVISLLLGDVTSVTSIGASLPTLLLQSGYSRAFELEADRVAGDYMIRQGWGTKPLEDMLGRLSQGGGGGNSILSTHPGTDTRIENLRRMEPVP